MSGDYTMLRDSRTREYTAAYREWVQGLSQVERAKLDALGLGDADDGERSGDAGLSMGDAAERPEASFVVDMAVALDVTEELLAEELGVGIEEARRFVAWHMERVGRESIAYKARLFQTLVAGFLEATNPRLAAAGLAFATNLAALNGLGAQDEFAKRIGVRRASVSKSTKWWQRELHLPTSSHMKSEGACTVYSKVTRLKHWRRKKYARSHTTDPHHRNGTANGDPGAEDRTALGANGPAHQGRDGHRAVEALPAVVEDA